MLDAGVPLVMITMLHEFDNIPLDVGPVISLSKDFVCQSLTSRMALVDAFMSLVQGIVDPRGSEPAKKWH